jgi:hypothetical protein
MCVKKEQKLKDADKTSVAKMRTAREACRSLSYLAVNQALMLHRYILWICEIF